MWADRRFTGLMDEWAKREGGVTTVDHDAHPLDGLYRVHPRRPAPCLLVPEAPRVRFVHHTVEADAVGRWCW